MSNHITSGWNWKLANALLCCAAGAATAQEYYRQSPTNNIGGYSSQDARNAGGLGWFSEVADNFPGQAGWLINRVEFWGGYASSPATPGNTRGFSIRIYSDSNGRPGDRLFATDVSSFQRDLYYTSPPSQTQPNGLAGYRYEVELTQGFQVPTDGQYWISIVAILDRGGTANEPQWGWIQASQLTAPSSQQWFFSPGNFAPVPVDSAFVLGQSETRCPADLDDGSGTGTPDGGVTLEDLLYYIDLYDSGSTSADLDNGTSTGTPDGGVTIEDLLYFLLRFDSGC